MSGSVLY
jgi:hypothetical protein